MNDAAHSSLGLGKGVCIMITLVYSRLLYHLMY